MTVAMAAINPLPIGGGGRHPLVQRILDGNAEETVRLSAARGALPLPLPDLLVLQVGLQRDPSEEIARTAADSLEKVPLASVVPLLKEPGCDPALLEHFALSGRIVGDDLAPIIAHPALPDTTLESLAAGASTEVLNLIVTNEVRIIGNPKLIDLLRANPSLSSDNRRRLIELARDFVGKEAVTSGGTRADEDDAAAEDALSELTLAAIAEAEAVGVDTSAPMSAEDLEHYDEETRRTPLFQRIMKLNVGQRMQLAMKANREARSILVRDTAKMVALQVMKSPKLSENEVTSYAAMRNVHDEILRAIASHGDWTKSYTVIHNLVRNPKTPPGISIRFLARLGTRDLKILVADKNLPEVVRRNVGTLYQARTQPSKKKAKKTH
jgi:hypothetical protein